MSQPNFGAGRPDPRLVSLGRTGTDHAVEVLENFPEIVCLSGSTKFKDEFREANAYLTLQGKIVLSVGFFHHADGGPPGQAEEMVEEGMDEDGEWKRDLDHLHFRKIDLADRLHVINVGGYVGESTEEEIVHAVMNDTPVTWYDEEQIPERFQEIA